MPALFVCPRCQSLGLSRRQLVVYAPAEVARSAGFIHLAIEEEQRAPNHQPVVRAGAWEVLGPWK